MTKFSRSIFTWLRPQNAFVVTRQYFLSQGYRCEDSTSSGLEFKRGSVMMSTGKWKTKKCELSVRIDRNNPETTGIQCDYKISVWTVTGKEDNEIDGEIAGLHSLIYDEERRRAERVPQHSIQSRQQPTTNMDDDRVSIKDSVAQRSSLCGGSQTKASQWRQSSRELSICPYCGKDLLFPEPVKFCPFCRKQILM